MGLFLQHNKAQMLYQDREVEEGLVSRTCFIYPKQLVQTFGHTVSHLSLAVTCQPVGRCNVRAQCVIE